MIPSRYEDVVSFKRLSIDQVLDVVKKLYSGGSRPSGTGPQVPDVVHILFISRVKVLVGNGIQKDEISAHGREAVKERMDLEVFMPAVRCSNEKVPQVMKTKKEHLQKR